MMHIYIGDALGAYTRLYYVSMLATVYIYSIMNMLIDIKA